MTADARLTKTQEVLLRAVARDEVTYHTPMRGRDSYYRHDRRVVTAVAVRLGRLIAVRPPQAAAGLIGARKVVLTDAGQAWLDTHPEKETQP